MVVFIGIKIVFDAVYEVWGNPDSTNWNIAYNSLNYLVIAAVLMFISQNTDKILFVKGHSSFMRWLFSVLGMLYTAYTMIEMTYINESIEVYRAAMTDGYFALNYAGVTLFSILLYTAIYKLKVKYNLQWI
tara:strand:+ start:12862 stop:13254 length:393 start_codon:yes stop_codon:yes gene_type:complete